MASCSGESSTHKIPRKRQKEEDSSSDNESDESSNPSDESFDENLEIPVEFEAFPPAECDFKSMKNLLKQLFLKSAVNLSELTDLIISQDKVGSIIKVADDESQGDDDDEQEGEEYEEEIYGLTTVLDFTQYKDKECIQQIKNLLLDKCKSCTEAETQQKFGNILKGRVGLLISERFINIPPHIAPPLFKALRGELQDRHKKDKNIILDHLLLISKSFKEKETQSSKKKKRKPGKKSAKPQQEKEANFSNVEDEVFMKESTLSFNYPVAASDEDTLLGGKWGYDDAVLEPYRTVMVIPYKRFNASISSQIEEFIGT